MSEESANARRREDGRRNAQVIARRALIVGWAVMGFGVLSLFQHRILTNPVYTVELAIGSNVIHDAIVAPLVCVVGYGVSRLVPKLIRAQITWGLFASAMVLLVGFVPLRGYGRKADNPSVLPLRYSTAVLTVLCFVWAITAVWSISSWWLQRRQR